MGKCCVSGCQEIEVNNKKETVTLANGRVGKALRLADNVRPTVTAHRSTVTSSRCCGKVTSSRSTGPRAR
jgi:hypothetical protein